MADIKNNTVRGPWPEENPQQGADETTVYVENLFRHYHDTLLHYISRFTPNREDAIEILQDTYVRLIRQQNLEHIRSNARAYLFKVATNLLRDKVRRDRSRHIDMHEPFDESLHEASLYERQESTPLRKSECDETLEHIKAALMTVPERCRQIFTMHRILGMSHPEIAAALDVSTRTVERNIKAALAACEQRIRKAL